MKLSDKLLDAIGRVLDARADTTDSVVTNLATAAHAIRTGKPVPEGPAMMMAAMIHPKMPEATKLANAERIRATISGETAKKAPTKKSARHQSLLMESTDPLADFVFDLDFTGMEDDVAPVNDVTKPANMPVKADDVKQQQPPPPVTPLQQKAVPLQDVVAFLDDFLGVKETPDYSGAANGLQVEGPGPVRRVVAAVDASEASIREAVAWRADLLLVHHGLYWDGLRPLTGRRFRKVAALIEGRTALYSAHLPLDAHPEVGNSAVLARKLGMEELTPFGAYEGASVGWMGRVGREPGVPVGELASRMEAVLDGPVHVLPGGPERIARAAVVTGAGASMLGEAAASGVDALVTGEAQHHHAIEAAEVGVSVLLGGHYATETWGVKAVVAKLRERFGVETMFADLPTGL